MGINVVSPELVTSYKICIFDFGSVPLKTFRPVTKPTSHEMNRDHKIFEFAQNIILKMQERQRYKTVYIIILRVKELLIP